MSPSHSYHYTEMYVFCRKYIHPSIHFQNLGMQPSQAGEVLITLKRRTMTSALNTKRRLCAVSRRQSVGYGLPQKRPNPSLFRISQTRTHSSNVFDDGSDAQVGP